jgi:integrase
MLSDNELAQIWTAAGLGDYGDIVRLLILTGQRREEVGGILWREIDLDRGVWSLEAMRTKNGLPHEVPLCAAAVDILRARWARNGRDLVFGLGDGPFQGWSNAKAALDARTNKAANVRGTSPVKPWRIHDLRRTVATRLADLGVLPHVIEAILNHVSGHKAGVAGIYNRSTYAAEKREALNRWGDYILHLPGRTRDATA